MNRFWAITALSSVIAGCVAGTGEADVPPLAVNQSGLSERLERMAPRRDDEEDAGPQTTGSEHPKSERTDTVSNADGELTEVAQRPVHPEKPQPSVSGDKIAFRRVERKSSSPKPGALSPSPAIAAGRDERTQRFRARERERMNEEDAER